MPEFDFTKLTKEQKKSVTEAYNKASMKMSFLFCKASTLLFALNLVTILTGLFFLKDPDPQYLVAYNLVTIGINVFFVSRYFSRRMNEIGDILKESISKIVKK